MSFTSRRKPKQISKQEKILLAKKAIQSGESIRSAALNFDIPVSTLHYSLGKVSNTITRLFSDEEEKVILKFIEERQKGSPLSKMELLETLNKDFLRVTNNF